MNQNLSCHLYKQDPIRRFWTNLQSIKLSLDKITRLDQIEQFDQMHYGGNLACEEAAKEIGLQEGQSILDIGGGLGGPARFLAHTYGCKIHSVEIQAELARTHKLLDERCSLSSQISVINTDFLKIGSTKTYDGIVSFLVFLHIKDKQSLWNKIFRLLKPGASFCIEDYFLRKPPSTTDLKTMNSTIGIAHLQTESNYKQTIRNAGLSLKKWEDLSSAWTDWTENRLENYRNQLSQQIVWHGIENCELLMDFYSAVFLLFKKGVIGGVRVSGTVCNDK